MILCAGDALVDLFALPRGAKVDEAEQFVPHPGGAPANVATLLGRLGAPARFLGVVGSDPHGKRLARALGAAGVDLDTLVQHAGRTNITFVHVGLNGERSFLFHRSPPPAEDSLRETLRAAMARGLSGARWVHVTSNLLVLDAIGANAAELLTAASARGIGISLDLNVRAHLWPDRAAMIERVVALARQADWLKASEEDLVALGLAPVVSSLTELAPRAVCVLTLAERGAELCLQPGALIRVPAPVADAIDATGAGDAFVAAVHAVLNQRGVTADSAAFREPSLWASTLPFACAVGARAVTAMGATGAFDPAGIEPFREWLRGMAPDAQPFQRRV